MNCRFSKQIAYQYKVMAGKLNHCNASHLNPEKRILNSDSGAEDEVLSCLTPNPPCWNKRRAIFLYPNC